MSRCKPLREQQWECNGLEVLKGKYNFGGGLFVLVTAEGIYVQGPGRTEKKFNEDETVFFSKKTPIPMEFIKEE